MSPDERKCRFYENVNKDGPVPAHRPDLGPCWVWTGPVDEKFPWYCAEIVYGVFPLAMDRMETNQ